MSKEKQQAKAKANTEKRVPKTTPKLKIELSSEQKEVARLFHEFDVLFIHGDFGSGKTLSAVHTALTHYNKRQCNEIWLTRPMLDNNLGALPGTLEEKLAPYTFPLKQNIEVCVGKEKSDSMQKDGFIKIMPVDVAKGCTFMDSVVIVDEYQDMDYQDFRTILTRLGKGSKMIFCGSKQQIDRRINRYSCIQETMKLEHSMLVGFVTLTSNHRNPILTKIIDFLEKSEEKTEVSLN